MNRIVTILGCVAVGSTMLSASAQTPLTLFPLKKGTTWTFSTQVAAQTIIQNVTVTDVVTRGNTKIATLDYKMNGSTMQTEVYQINAKGIARLKAGAAGSGSVAPPILILPAVIVAGTKWKWKGMITTQGQNIPGSADFTLSAPQSVTVPAGKFNAYRVRFFLTMTAPKNAPQGAGGTVRVENSYWFAPNVGIVKQEVKIGQQAITGVLTKYNVVK